MNYEGSVSSVDTTLWTFELDQEITVHMGHLAAYDSTKLLPEIGEKVQIYNAHYKISNCYQLKRLFLCEHSSMDCCEYKDYVQDDGLLKVIQDYSLGVSDLLEIDHNIKVIKEFLDEAAKSPEEIMLEVLRCIAYDSKGEDANAHKCLNKNLKTFTLKTISSCQFVDHSSDEIKGPPWSFGTHSKASPTDLLIGYLRVNKRFGLVFFCDAKYKMACLITSKNKLDQNQILNRFILVKNYRIFTEMYKEEGAFNSEYILINVEDVIVLDLESKHSSVSLMYDKHPEDLHCLYNFEFQLFKKSPVSISNSTPECWLDILIKNGLPASSAYLGLNEHQIQLVPFLHEGETYHVYHNVKLKDVQTRELSKMDTRGMCCKFNEKSVVFVHPEAKTESDKFINPILTVEEALQRLKENKCVSFQGILSSKTLTPALSSRIRQTNLLGFGTPGSSTHTLRFTDDKRENSVVLYVNDWGNLLIPLGLVIDMRICVRNVLPQKGKYLKSCMMTTFDVLGYEPQVFFDTVNLCTNSSTTYNKYSFVGYGDLIPCGVLIWARIIQLRIRSLRVQLVCDSCDEKLTCSCTKPRSLETTITMYVHDEMGHAMVISKSTELLRNLLGLEEKQWKIWCKAFEHIGEYVHDFGHSGAFFENDSEDSLKNSFCKALELAVKVVNATKLSDLELLCRKIESNIEDNDGMPVWFCIDARIQD